MFDRYWLRDLATAVGLFIALVAFLSQVGERRDQHAAEGPESPARAEYQHAEALPANAAPEAVVHAPRPERDADEGEGNKAGDIKWTEIGDLIAQWTMALATIAIVGFTYWGVRILRSTLRETESAADLARQTLTEAEKTTAAAIETTTETRRIGEAQARSYIRCAGGTATRNAKGYVTFEADLNNTGMSPALNVATYCHYDAAAPARYIGTFDRRAWTNHGTANGDLGSAETRSIYVGSTRFSEIRGTGYLIQTMVVWKDIFGKTGKAIFWLEWPDLNDPKMVLQESRYEFQK